MKELEETVQKLERMNLKLETENIGLKSNVISQKKSTLIARAREAIFEKRLEICLAKSSTENYEDQLCISEPQLEKQLKTMGYMGQESMKSKIDDFGLC